MRKYFIADVLTAAKIIPAIVLVVATVDRWSPLVAVLWFAIGELLDALDGMAAHRWPHPEWTNELWFRKNIKVLESGLDMILGISALVYTMVRVDFWFGTVILASALVIGTICEFVLYGRLLGSKSQCKPNSLMKRNPKKAQIIVAVRLIAYLLAIAALILKLLFTAFTSVEVRVAIVVTGAIVAFLVAVKKYEDGRLKDVEEVAKRLQKK